MMASIEQEIYDFEQNEVESAVEAQFSKYYTLPSYIQNCHSHSNYIHKARHHMPPVSRWFDKTNEKWTESELMLMKEDLNATKGLLNDKPLEDWHRHTRFRNPASDVISRVRSRGANPELLTQVQFYGQFLSQHKFGVRST